METVATTPVEAKAPAKGISVPLSGAIVACLAVAAVAFLLTRPATAPAPDTSVPGPETALAEPRPEPPAPAASAQASADAGEVTSAPVARTAPAPPLVLALPASPAPAAAPSIEDTARRAMQAVASIEADGNQGSGFFTTGGLLLTNAHVVGSRALVKVRQADGQVQNGHVVRAVPSLDLAVVRTDRPVPSHMWLRLRPVREARVGQEVLAIGSALGVLQNTVTRGIVSGVRDAGGVTLIQTDAAVNPGNSGGPLVDRDGFALGVTTIKIFGQAEALGFAVAADHARPLLEGRDAGAPSGGGSLQERVQAAVSGDTRSAGDRAREEATAAFENEVEAVEQAADRLDGYWDDYKATCLSTTKLPKGYDREWIAVLAQPSVIEAAPPACRAWTQQMVTNTATVRRAMVEALEQARRDGVFPGDLREIQRRHRLEWGGW
ncbi:MAG: serine protease [Acidobacteria bacterium]|nr:serine protease [Acidobacteriota bacterium]